MTAERVKRKLAAILSADVKGYSRLMSEDEVGTIRTLTACKEVLTGFIQNYQGRVVGTAGDSVLAEFASVVEAVQCAVEIQNELKRRNADIPESRRMAFRIGVNLGDVVEEGDTIYGDGVNIAARLESLAEAGGICISRMVYDNIKNKLALGYEDLGEQTVKNIKEAVRVYRVRTEPETVSAKVGKEGKPVGKRLFKVAFGLMAVAVIAGAVILYQFVLRPSPPKTEVASKEKMAFPLPNVPSIAVLPFVNMSGDPKQEFLCDGITESIITALSKVPSLFVISRDSAFPYKGKTVKVKQVSEELGVRYVMEGSVQRSADRVRITAQLIDALTGNHLWADRYDRDLKDLFALQDEITTKILTATQVKLTAGERASMVEKYFRGKQGLDCYLKILEGSKYLQLHTIEDNNIARRIAEEAIAMCPEVPWAYNLLAWVYRQEYRFGSAKSPRETLEKSIELAQKTLTLDDSIAEAHALLSHLYCAKREYDRAIAEGERAVALDPGGAVAHEWYAATLVYACRPEEAIPLFQKAIRLSPLGSTSTFVFLGHALRMAGRFEEAVSAYKKALQLSANNIFAHIGLAVTYIQIGREKEAGAEAAEVLKLNPKFSVDSFGKTLSYKDQSVTDHFVDALRKAGLK